LLGRPHMPRDLATLMFIAPVPKTKNLLKNALAATT
jgi:hypothetical protein